MNKPKISFLVTCKNEGMALEKLLERLKRHCTTHPECNTVVLDDFSTDEYTKNVLNSYKNLDNFIIRQHKLTGDFSEHKNYGNSLCTGEYIFAIDADEIPSDFLLDNLNAILNSNSEVELYCLPRVNILLGLNERELLRWGWNLSKLEEFKDEKILDTESEEYKFLKKYGFIIEEMDL